ncbi:glutathione S-transferase TCHQD isoform X1 [Nicotiana tomentosiformis]|uniref:glutathione S-transferase TCHQD isoform X1 n=3 Tax=Nicotiana tomentosiformis TaxID=4098 RepID=UPI00051C6CF2|nr:glutathione S-transferase TCHQD isoform X1 [Nicotiana tomentosiformis]XP_009591544.1 glutathione S-transferase TCHQD isoform X1 [Nicotiana tomentosiformis]
MVMRCRCNMQLYHHPLSLDSQKVRLTLEEKGIDYTSHHVNPLTGKNMDTFFFSMNPSAKIPVFQNGSHIIYDTVEIIQYIERIAEKVSSGGNNLNLSSREVVEWMHKIQEWDSMYFTLFHVPDKYRLYVSKFLRRVIIARMAESPDLASAYHCKLRDAYDTDDKLKNADVLRRCEDHLVRLLDEVEVKLGETSYLAGEEFSLADVVLIPVLARLQLLNLEDEYINSRPNTADYWMLVKQRPSYKKVIGRYFDGWKRRKTLLKTWCFIRIRSMLRKY